MKEFFINHQEKNNDINSVKPDWNYFIFLLQSLIPQENYEQYLLNKKTNYNTNIKQRNGKDFKTKLITEIPLEIYDNEAFDILFKKINQDVHLVEQWANSTFLCCWKYLHFFIIRIREIAIKIAYNTYLFYSIYLFIFIF